MTNEKMETVAAVVLAARDLMRGAVPIPDDTIEYAPIDGDGVRRGEYLKRRNAAYVQRDDLAALRCALDKL